MPSVIRGSDDFDSDEYGGLGHNQTWQNVTSSRSSGVTYTNTTGKPIMVSIRSDDVASTAWFRIVVDGIIVIGLQQAGTTYQLGVGGIVVPNGSTYSYVKGSASVGTVYYLELR